ncbi:MAG TPA: DUF4097 family beta strand repeat-containing protein [Solirubrobacteraceae bacterium]|jgi:DUF4097 and DUF4098 domain-containing protein YvlB|nr:DUF4097 family beta strand repeat-containing protein [Solirubrobacteraceae bacterium]
MNIPNALLAAAILAAAAPAATAQQTINKNAKVAPDATVEVTNVQGTIEITAWDRNEVDLVAVLESPKDQLEYEASERHVRIEVERERGKYKSDGDDARLTLRVPTGARVIADAVSADITVKGVRGEQSLESVSGEIDTQAFDAPVKANSVSGEVTIVGNGGKASVSTENVSGSSTVTGVRGDFSGEVVSGELRATIADAGRVDASTVSGDIELSVELNAASRVDLESVSGGIGLKIKPPVNADFDIESFSGDIENCFGPKPRETSKYTPSTELDFTQGSGGARVEIETLSGEIRVCDR